MVHIGREEPSFSSEVIIILWLVVKEKLQSSDPSPAMLPTCIMTAKWSNKVTQGVIRLRVSPPGLIWTEFEPRLLHKRSRIQLLTNNRSRISQSCCPHAASLIYVSACKLNLILVFPVNVATEAEQQAVCGSQGMILPVRFEVELSYWSLALKLNT